MLNKLRSAVYLLPVLLLSSMMSMAADQQPQVVESGMSHMANNRSSSNSLLEIMSMMEQLRQDMRSLRGEVEVQSNQVQQINKRQRNLYVDIDRRLRVLEVMRRDDKKMAIPMEGVKPALNKSINGKSKLYDHALNLLRETRYEEAATAFRQVLTETPDSAYADNSQYWLAETFYVTRQFASALKAFQSLLDNYKDSNKRADAYLKMGYIQYELKKNTEARILLNKVLKLYTGTTAARLAEERLRRMKREGR